MLRQNFKLFIAIILVASFGSAAIQTEDEKLIEELTGGSSLNKTNLQKSTLKKMSEPEKHLFAGLDAFGNKNYIQALKHYNAVIAKFPKSKEVRFAYIAKAKLYNEMGLPVQANLNSRMAVKLGEKKSK